MTPKRNYYQQFDFFIDDFRVDNQISSELSHFRIYGQAELFSLLAIKIFLILVG